MTQFVGINPSSGEIVEVIGQRDPEDFTGTPDPRPFPRGGIVYHAWQGRIVLSAHPTPSAVLKWIDDAPQWADLATLDEAKANAWARIKADREEAERGTFLFNGDLYDLNKENVSGAAMAATIAQLAGRPFSIRWTLADNTVRAIDGPTMQDIGMAMVAYIDGLHDIARIRRERIEAATAPAEAYAVTWPADPAAEIAAGSDAASAGN